MELGLLQRIFASFLLGLSVSACSDPSAKATDAELTALFARDTRDGPFIHKEVISCLRLEAGMEVDIPQNVRLSASGVCRQMLAPRLQNIELNNAELAYEDLGDPRFVGRVEDLKASLDERRAAHRVKREAERDQQKAEAERKRRQAFEQARGSLLGHFGQLKDELAALNELCTAWTSTKASIPSEYHRMDWVLPGVCDDRLQEPALGAVPTYLEKVRTAEFPANGWSIGPRLPVPNAALWGFDRQRLNDARSRMAEDLETMKATLAD